jgi:hypothetical protein
MALFDRARGFSWLALGMLASGCGGGEGSFVADAGDTDSATDTDVDTDTNTDTGTDTGEDETPPDLPALCSTDVFNTAASGLGDGRAPDVEAGTTAALIAWAYDPQEDAMPEQWRIQATAYDPLAPDIAPVEPFPLSPNALWPAMTARDDGFGLVWLDSRWDVACDPGDPDTCAVDVALAVLDAAGASTGAEPIRLTTSGLVARGRPAIAVTPDGWLAAWAEYDGTDTLRIMAVALTAEGVPGTPQIVSGDKQISGEAADVGLAAGGDVAVAVWQDQDLNTVYAQPISFDGTPVGDAAIVDQGVQTRPPRIAAGTDGFLVAWSRRTVDDFEIFSRLLTATGAPLGEPNRLTWTISDESGAVPAWDGDSYGVAWFGNRANGTEECVDPNCEDQAFASVLDADGAMASVPVLLSDNANPSSNGDLEWDGSGWTMVWEVQRDLRQQVYRGRFVCE